jgi:hypothetical protein
MDAYYRFLDIPSALSKVCQVFAAFHSLSGEFQFFWINYPLPLKSRTACAS